MSGKVIRTADVDLKINSVQKGDSEEGGVEVANVIEWDFEGAEVQLWWPIGYGSQHLYTVEVTLLDQVSLLVFIWYRFLTM